MERGRCLQSVVIQAREHVDKQSDVCLLNFEWRQLLRFQEILWLMAMQIVCSWSPRLEHTMPVLYVLMFSSWQHSFLIEWNIVENKTKN